MTIRNNPEIKKIWNRLCGLHMKAMVTLEHDVGDKKELIKIRDELLKPRACIEALHLSEEETCCGRFLKRIREGK